MNILYSITIVLLLASCGSSSVEKKMDTAIQSQTVTLTPAQAKNADLSFGKLFIDKKRHFIETLLY
jgi:hypothetical protein